MVNPNKLNHERRNNQLKNQEEGSRQHLLSVLDPVQYKGEKGKKRQSKINNSPRNPGKINQKVEDTSLLNAKTAGAQFVTNCFTNYSGNPFKLITSLFKNEKNHSIFIDKMEKTKNDKKNIKENANRKAYTDSFLGACIILLKEVKNKEIFTTREIKSLINTIKHLAEETKFYDFKKKIGNTIIIDALNQLETGELEENKLQNLEKNIQFGTINNKPLSEIFKIEQITLDKAQELFNNVQTRTKWINSKLQNKRFNYNSLKKASTLYTSAQNNNKETIPQEIFVGLLLDHITQYLTSYNSTKDNGVTVNNGDITEETRDLIRKLETYATKQGLKNKITAITTLVDDISQNENEQ